MLRHWNKELKRQSKGSRNSSNTKLQSQIVETAQYEAERVLNAGKKGLSKSAREEIAAKVHRLYSKFPEKMAEQYHKRYEAEIKKYVKSQK